MVAVCGVGAGWVWAGRSGGNEEECSEQGAAGAGQGSECCGLVASCGVSLRLAWPELEVWCGASAPGGCLCLLLF